MCCRCVKVKQKDEQKSLTRLLVLRDLVVIVCVVIFIFYLVPTRGCSQEAQKPENHEAVHDEGLRGASGAFACRFTACCSLHRCHLTDSPH